MVQAFSNSEWEGRGAVREVSFSKWQVREADWPAGPTYQTQGASPSVEDRPAIPLLNFRMLEYKEAIWLLDLNTLEYKEAIWSLNRSLPAFTQALLSLRRALGMRPKRVKEENWRR